MQIQCIHIRGDCENTFCLYMRLLRFDVQLLFPPKKDRNFYEPSNSEQKQNVFYVGTGLKISDSVFRIFTLFLFFLLQTAFFVHKNCTYEVGLKNIFGGISTNWPKIYD